MVIITSTINVHGYIEILGNFLIQLIENWLGDNEVIFRDDNESFIEQRGLKLFFRKGI